jgi:hypothetical protein
VIVLGFWASGVNMTFFSQQLHSSSPAHSHHCSRAKLSALTSAATRQVHHPSLQAGSTALWHFGHYASLMSFTKVVAVLHSTPAKSGICIANLYSNVQVQCRQSDINKHLASNCRHCIHF